jgi:tRNA dimethylallyltransferase
MTTRRPLVPVLVGPTGVGKTAVALELGRRTPVTVISADARQVYRHLEIGTAKPGPELLAELPHLGIDLIAPGERYSAGRFAQDAAAWLEEIRSAGRWPLVVGGTGFYVRALAEGLFREPPLDVARREPLRVWTARLPAARAAHWAVRLDRHFAAGGRQRAARAIEIALLTGRPLSWWQREARETGKMRPWYIHLTLPREALARRIAERTDRMLGAGLVEEVEALLARGVPPEAPGLDGIGYREVVTMLQGGLPATGVRDAIVRATRRYAKRQETWFRNQLRPEPSTAGGPGAVWMLDATEPATTLADLILERWQLVRADD